MSFDRSSVLPVLARYVPSVKGEPMFEAMTQGKYDERFGSSCGFLPAAMLEDLGCREAAVMNRDVPGTDIRFEIGQNLAKIVHGGRSIGAFVEYSPSGQQPKLGDVLYFGDGSPGSEHVNVFLAWGTDARGARVAFTADAGQRAPSGHQASQWRDDVSGSPPPGHGPARHVSADGRRFEFFGGSRPLVGFLDLDRLSFPAAPAAESSDGDSSGLFVLLFALGLGGAYAWIKGIL